MGLACTHLYCIKKGRYKMKRLYYLLFCRFGRFGLLLSAAVGAGFISASVRQVEAAPITFVVSGSILAAAPVLGGTITPGSTFTVTYTFEPETPDLQPDPTIGDYKGAVSTIELKVDGYSASWVGSPADLLVYDDVFFGKDFYELTTRFAVGSFAAPPINGYALTELTLNRLADASTFGSDALPVTPAFFSAPFNPVTPGFFSEPFNAVTGATLFLLFADAFTAATSQAFGTISGAAQAVAAVEPGALLLFGIALAALALYRRKAIGD